jgi:ABC-type transport system substrate-binding protein/PKD repeat protein
VTVQDIIFTYNLIQETDNNYLQYYFPEIPGEGGRLIESMTAVGDYELYILLRSPYAPFISALTSIPILPEYIWSTQSWNWKNYDATYPPCVGSGSVCYGMAQEPDAGVVEMLRNPYWFGTTEYGWQLHCNKIVWRSETEDSNLQNYQTGVNDIITNPTPDQFLGASMPGTRYTSSQGFVFEFNMNQLTEADRDLYSIGSAADYNNQLLLDPVIRMALMKSIDKEDFVTSAIRGLGKPADSLMPEVSPWYYDYGGPERIDPDEAEVSFDTAAARALLYANGWKYRLTGSEILPADSDYLTYYPLSKLVGGVVTDTLQFRFITPSEDSYFTEGSLLIEQDAAATGVDLIFNAENSNTMNTLWYAADYDTWLWDWWFVPNSEPSVDVMEVLATEAIGSWSDVYWSNATYDALYYESLSEMNPESRALLLDELQRMAYEESGCFPVAWMDMLYAAQTVGPDNWMNYGNWTQKYTLTPDSGYPWVFIQMYPSDNPSPQITGWTDPYETTTTLPVTFSATAVDTDVLEYMWNFGDGTKSSWSSSPGASHLYTADGYYTAWLMVREVGTLDGFMTSKMTTVKVIDISNTAPYGLDFTFSPSDPDQGTFVYLNGTASDANPGDSITYTWDFGDGSVATGQNVIHQFSEGAGSYTVRMYADDSHLGTEPRPVSTSKLVSVAVNTAPTIVAQDEPSVQFKVMWTFYATAVDPDARDTLVYTWDWGDGTAVSVTSTGSADHKYGAKGTYTLTVYCDDQTGLPGHNSSDTATVVVVQVGNHVPVITDFHVSNDMPLTGEVVTFYGTATDMDGDLLVYTWEYGDGMTDTSTQTTPDSTLTIDHIYASAGAVLAYLTVYDGQASTTIADPLIIDVQQGNQAPVIAPFTDVIATVGVSETFTASATDADLDPLTYYWEFHDGTELGNPVAHTFTASSGEFGSLFTVYVDDGQGNNVSESGLVYVNWLPWIGTPLTDMTVSGLESNPYTVTATDNDSADVLTVTWDFGDGSVMVGSTVNYAYADVATPTMYTLTVYVEDNFDDPDVSHNVSSTSTVTVNPAGDTENPVANAGPDQNVLAGELVTFDGSGSSDNVGIVSWVWTFTWNSVPVTLTGETATYTFDSSFVDVTVTLTVTDAAGNSATDEMIVHVGDWIPEMSTILLPVVGTMILVAAALVVRRRKEQ